MFILSSSGACYEFAYGKLLLCTIFIVLDNDDDEFENENPTLLY